MTPREKLELFAQIHTKKRFFNVGRKVRGLEIDLISGQVYQRLNLRQVIAHRLNECGISRNEAAYYLDLRPCDFSSYMHGRRSLPYDKLERLLGLLFCDTELPPEDLKETEEERSSDEIVTKSAPLAGSF